MIVYILLVLACYYSLLFIYLLCI